MSVMVEKNRIATIMDPIDRSGCYRHLGTYIALPILVVNGPGASIIVIIVQSTLILNETQDHLRQ